MQRDASATCVTYMIPRQTHDQLGVELFKAICRRDKHRHHEFGKHVLPGIMGYALGTGTGRAWRITRPQTSPSKRIKGLITGSGKQIFTCADGALSQAGHVALRLFRHRQLQKEDADAEDHLEAGSEVPSTPRAVERQATEDKDDFESIAGDHVHRHHDAPRDQLYATQQQVFVPDSSGVHRREQTDEKIAQSGGEQHRRLLDGRRQQKLFQKTRSASLFFKSSLNVHQKRPRMGKLKIGQGSAKHKKNVLLKRKKWLPAQKDSDLVIGVSVVQDQKHAHVMKIDRHVTNLLTVNRTNSLSE